MFLNEPDTAEAAAYLEKDRADSGYVMNLESRTSLGLEARCRGRIRPFAPPAHRAERTDPQ